METKVTINLVDGRKIGLTLFGNAAPKTIQNFLKLAREGFYEGLCFHRVIEGFMIQGGGFEIADNELKQKHAETIEGEFAANKIDNPLKHDAGVISMARTPDKNSASSQFFICAEDCPYLDGQYAAFGKTDEKGLEVVREISQTKTGRWMAFDDFPRVPIVIKSIVVHE